MTPFQHLAQCLTIGIWIMAWWIDYKTWKQPSLVWVPTEKCCWECSRVLIWSLDIWLPKALVSSENEGCVSQWSIYGDIHCWRLNKIKSTFGGNKKELLRFPIPSFYQGPGDAFRSRAWWSVGSQKSTFLSWANIKAKAAFLRELPPMLGLTERPLLTPTILVQVASIIWVTQCLTVNYDIISE